jgi:hypothetical protein
MSDLESEYRWAVDHPRDKLADAFLSLPWGSDDIDTAKVNTLRQAICKRIGRKRQFSPISREDLINILSSQVFDPQNSPAAHVSFAVVSNMIGAIMSSKILDLVNFCGVDHHGKVIDQDVAFQRNIVAVSADPNHGYNLDLRLTELLILTKKHNTPSFDEYLLGALPQETEKPKIDCFPSNPYLKGYDTLVIPAPDSGKNAIRLSDIPGAYVGLDLYGLKIILVKGMSKCSILARTIDRDKRSLRIGFENFCCSPYGQTIRIWYDLLDEPSYLVCQ